METAPARQPRTGPAGPRRRRTISLALAVVGMALAASAVVMQPFAASHLFPGGAGPRHTATAPPSAAIAGPVLPVAPTAVAPSREERAAAAPARGEPAAHGPTGVAEPTVAISGSLPSAASMAARPVPVAPVAAPTPRLVAPPAAVAGVPVLPPAPITAPAPAAAAPVGGTPPPREPLPLQTDLLPPHG